jgi:hypothetical protein
MVPRGPGSWWPECCVALEEEAHWSVRPGCPELPTRSHPDFSGLFGSLQLVLWHSIGLWVPVWAFGDKGAAGLQSLQGPSRVLTGLSLPPSTLQTMGPRTQSSKPDCLLPPWLGQPQPSGCPTCVQSPVCLRPVPVAQGVHVSAHSCCDHAPGSTSHPWAILAAHKD